MRLYRLEKLVWRPVTIVLSTYVMLLLVTPSAVSFASLTSKLTKLMWLLLTARSLSIAAWVTLSMSIKFESLKVLKI